MTGRIVGVSLAGTLLVSACENPVSVSPTVPYRPLVAQNVPADGNGNKLVIPIDVVFPDAVTCTGGTTLTVHAVGFVQIRVFGQPNNRNVELDVLHVVLTFSNAAGETFVWREFGPDHFYLAENGDLIHTVSGRDGFDGVIGHIVINTVTGEVEFVAGKPAFRNDLACAALT